jgi:hypothetical protein
MPEAKQTTSLEQNAQVVMPYMCFWSQEIQYQASTL